MIIERWRLLALLGLDRKRARGLRRAGDTARDAGEWQTAVAAYRRYLAMRPTDWAIRVQLGHALKESGDLKGAEAAYLGAAALAPGNADIHLQIGHLLKVAGRRDEARAAYARSAGIEPDGPAAAELRAIATPSGAFTEERSLGDAARDARDWRKATRHYRAHLQTEPDDWPIWVQLANMLKEIGDFEGAEKAYLKAIGYDDTVADTYLQLGHLLKLAGRRDAAIEAYRRSAELDGSSEAVTELEVLNVQVDGPVPEATQASFEIVLEARAARDLGRLEAADALYRRFLSAAPSDWRIWFELALVLRRGGLLHQAYDAVERAASISEGAVQVINEQARVLRLLGRVDASQALYMRVVQKTGSADMFKEVGLNIRL